MLTRRTAYALRALLHLAESPNFYGSARELSGAEAVPRRFLEAILRELLREGLVESRRGQRRGYVLSQPRLNSPWLRWFEPWTAISSRSRA